MKNLCIVDTCSLIYLANTDTALGNKTPFAWLWDEFEIHYSQAVSNEIKKHRAQIPIKRKDFEKYVWPHPIKYERKLFGTSVTRVLQNGLCRHCHQPIISQDKFNPDLSSDNDRGERHNCCIAIDAIVRG